MDWIVIPLCILAGAMIVWIQLCEAREQRNTGDHIRALQITRTFAAAMSEKAAAHGPPDDITHRVQRVVETVCEQAVYPERSPSIHSDSVRPTTWYLTLVTVSRREFEQIQTVADAISLVQTKLVRRL